MWRGRSHRVDNDCRFLTLELVDGAHSGVRQPFLLPVSGRRAGSGYAKGVPISDLARVFPDMPPEDFVRLVASIREDGLMDPITVWRGQVIDGRHRYAACAEAGVERRFEYLDDDADPLRYILARNDLRHHLDESQRAVVAHKLSASSACGRPRKENGANLHSSFTRAEAAALLRVSRRTVAHAARVLSEDSPAASAVRLAVEQGQITVSDASRVIDEPPEVQLRALERVISGGSRNLAGAARQVNDETSRQEDVAALESNRARPMAETITLHHAAVAGLDRLVAEASVDAIVTNPPTSHEALPLFSDLAAFAAHALRPGGVMAVLANAMRLPAIIGHLTHPGLEWAAEFDYRYGGPPVSSGYPHRVSLGRKPLLIYGKTGFRLQGGNDVIEVPPPDEPAMRPQVRQRDDAGMALIVERFARPGQVGVRPGPSRPEQHSAGGEKTRLHLHRGRYGSVLHQPHPGPAGPGGERRHDPK